MHGHNYVVEIIMQANQLDEKGFVFDINDLEPFQKIIDDELDHRHLNDILPGFTSAECPTFGKWT